MARNVRRAVTSERSRVDDRQRHLFLQKPPQHRMVFEDWQRHGILLPFSHDREIFTVPNPTIFQKPSWPMIASDNPVDGWLLSDVLQGNSGSARNDFQGMLYHLIRNQLTLFHPRLRHHACHFQLYSIDDAAELSEPIKPLFSFDRIEVANMSGVRKLGPDQTVHLMTPLLRAPQENPHATLITLFLTAVTETYKMTAKATGDKDELRRMFAYDGKPPSTPTFRFDARLLALLNAVGIVRDGDEYFNRYMELLDFEEIEEQCGVAMKEPHTIIEKWPLRIKLRPGQTGAKEEFERLLASGQMGMQRYVEWQRTE
ncbi:uncharacterized protein LTR77_006963 [Saxophila tyrrhenica]|uniref:Uncharacterized protein n=1 Tax=Saxophila tyrrhenica TaxID=1690608 RepID=A0AAV9P6T7_9PEZI|nr:hypothetical protein LTR77_006963 [Saxophila tyrrhenica]